MEISVGDYIAQNNTLSRRNALRLGAAIGLMEISALAAAGCSPQTPVTPRPTPRTVAPTNVPTSLVISPERAILLARSLSSLTDYPNIARAGEVLLKNQQSEPVYSGVDPVFIDQPVKIIPGTFEFKEFLPSGPKVRVYSPTYANITEAASYKTVFIPNKDNPDIGYNIAGRSNLTLSNIWINDPEFTATSDIFYNLFLAKAVLHPEALASILTNITESDYKNMSQRPSDVETQNMFKVYIYNKFDIVLPSQNIFVPQAAILEGYINFLPDYLQAKDQNKFKQTDVSKLALFDVAAQIFTSRGLITRENGVYIFSQNTSESAQSQARTDFFQRGINLLTGPAT